MFFHFVEVPLAISLAYSAVSNSLQCLLLELELMTLFFKIKQSIAFSGFLRFAQRFCYFLWIYLVEFLIPAYQVMSGWFPTIEDCKKAVQSTLNGSLGNMEEIFFDTPPVLSSSTEPQMMMMMPWETHPSCSPPAPEVMIKLTILAESHVTYTKAISNSISLTDRNQVVNSHYNYVHKVSARLSAALG